MIKMKYIKIISNSILLVAVLSLTSSCSLDETILDAPTPKTINSEEDATAVVIGMYSRFNDNTMFKNLGYLMLTLSADDVYSLATGDFAFYSQRVLTSANTSPMWNGFYATIKEANNLIQIVESSNFSQAFKNRALGEAYFIRAFSYYYLVRLYGGAPLRLEPTLIDSDLYLRRSTVDEVYAQIFKDFKAASERLPLAKSIPSGELGRASKGAAQAILAQAYLTYGNQKALKGQPANEYYISSVIYADSVLNSGQYNLLTNYGELFDINREDAAYNEVIFGIRFQTDIQRFNTSAAGSEFARRYASSYNFGVTASGGAGDNTLKIAHWFVDYYRSGDYLVAGQAPFTPNIDYRNEKAFVQRCFSNNSNRFFVVYPNIPGSTNPGSTTDGTATDPYAQLAKYQDPGGKDIRNHGNDLFIIRLAEVYLIKAEALNEISGPVTDALNAFNMVRTRARTVDGIPEARPVPANLVLGSVDQDQFRMKIFDERGIEMVGEGQRWFDLVRMRSPLSASETMLEYQFTDRLNNESIYPRTLPAQYVPSISEYDVSKNAIYVPMLNVGIPKSLLFPIPDTELLQNPNIGSQNQNPGW